MPFPSPFVSRSEFNLLEARVTALETENASQAALITSLQTQLTALSSSVDQIKQHFPHQ